LAEHLCAFANLPNGGFLVFGVDNNSKPVGVEHDQIGVICNALANLGREAVVPPLQLHHEVVEFDGIPLLIVHIPEQPHKPVHRRGKSVEESWIRSGGTTRKASRAEIGALMLHSSAPRWEELRASQLRSPEQVFELLDLAAIRALLQRPSINDTAERLRWANDEKLVVPDADGYYITNLGAIAAARELNVFDGLTRKSVRVIRYAGANKVDAVGEVVIQKGYAIGFEALIDYLKQLLPQSEVIKQSLRHQVTVYPEIALRELIANALIHQDFTISGAGPLIEIFADRITITNPGGLLPGKQLDRLIGTTPQSRNEALAFAFRKYRICEERGTGFQKVITAIELFGLPPLMVRQHENAFQATLYAPRAFANMSQAERIEACYQHAVLQYFSSQTLTNTSLRQRFKLHDKQRNQITNLISEAGEAGRIKRKDVTSSNKFAEYVPYWPEERDGVRLYAKQQIARLHGSRLEAVSLQGSTPRANPPYLNPCAASLGRRMNEK
jgi:predicted HTH transcriptional regulator